ncbi:hypothetical protein Pelo_11226 [Pelomyxa schiedti]|nr:hypothetical protein Pelo_11226 [Pelomyxa schiedti]
MRTTDTALRTLFLSFAFVVLFWNHSVSGNTCADASNPIVALPYSTIGDTSSEADSPFVCSLFNFVNDGDLPGHFFQIISSTTKDMVVSTCGSGTNFDTVLAIFTTCTSSGASGCLAFNDDSCGGGKSTIRFTATQDVSYYVFVSGYSGAKGTYQLDIYENVVYANSNCSGAVTINNAQLPYVTSGSTVGLPSCYSACSYSSLGGMWYKITGKDMTFLANTCDDAVNYDTLIEIYSNCSNGVASGCVGRNDDYCDRGSQITWESSASITYYIFVTGYSGSRGSFVLTVDSVAVKPHSDCSYAMEVPRIPWIYSDSTYAVPASYSSCLNANKRSLWFVVEGNGNTLIATTCYENSAGHDTMIEVYDNCENHNETGCIRYNDDYCGFYSSVSFNTTSGTEYWIAVSGYHNDLTGVNFTLTVANQQTVSNDQCWFAKSITLPGDYSATTTTSAYSYGDCSSTSSQRKGRWYQYVPEENVQVTATTCTNTTSAVVTIEVYTSCTLYTCTAQSTTVCGNKAQVTWAAQKGRQYLIFVATPVGVSTGFFHIQFYNSQPVNHSTCDHALAISSLPFIGTGDTLSTIHSSDTCLQQNKQGVWYSVVGTGSKLRVDTCGPYTDFDTMIVVYSGCPATVCGSWNDDMSSCGFASKLEFDTDSGALYYIFVTGFGDTTGIFSLNVLEVTAPSNSLCSNPYEIVSDIQTVGDFTYYSDASSGDCSGSTTYKGLWYRVSGSNQYIDISTCSDDNLLDTDIQVFSGCDDDAGTGCSYFTPDHTCGHAHLNITSLAVKGKPQYWYVFVQGSGSSEGYITTTFIKSAMPIQPVEDNGLSDGTIAGIVFGVVCGVAAVSAGCVLGFLWWRKRTQQGTTYAPVSTVDTDEKLEEKQGEKLDEKQTPQPTILEPTTTTTAPATANVVVSGGLMD